ncbi:hypothetical protein RR42_s0584 [Cupriavidus basilensis]|uniref:Uncharacterized protein n=1 Tax=Cupriavidus basilensis TaxID=68895 RepID=A0A0C4Y9N3_9BURK|nr:hypothetical protein RR42_s0584 [Cupriavidus basilensis]
MGPSWRAGTGNALIGDAAAYRERRCRGGIARLFRPLKVIRTTGAGRPEYKPKKRPIPEARQQ